MVLEHKGEHDTAVKSRSRAMITLKTLIVNAPAALREQLDRLTGRVALVRHLAGLHPGPLTSTIASTKAALKALARRWLMLDAEIKEHDAALDALTDRRAAGLKAAFGIATGTAAEMLILVGDNPERIRSEAAFAKLCGVCPIPASSGKTSRHRLNRGGNRQANAALYRVVITRMRSHQPTLAYVAKRLAQGRTKREIVRCLKRYVAREILGHPCGFEGRSSRSHDPLAGHRSINALAETINGLFKAEVIHRRGPWRIFEAVEFAILEWVDWSCLDAPRRARGC